MGKEEQKKAIQEALLQRIKEREAEKPQMAIQGLDSAKNIAQSAIQGWGTNRLTGRKIV